jgi:hypothetical protein
MKSTWRVSVGVGVLAWALGAWAQTEGAASASHALPALTAPAGVQNYANGQVQRRIEQSRAQRSERSYFPTSVLQRETVWDMAGKTAVPVRDLQYAASGVLLHERRWACGELVLDAQFLATGVLVSKKEVLGQGPSREMHVQEYVATGVLVREQRLALPANGKPYPIGVQKQADANGQPVREQQFDEQGRLVEEKTWSATGEVTTTRGPGTTVAP